MLGPDYILHLSEKAEAISELLHNAIVSRIVARFIRQMERYGDLSLGSAARWQLKVLQEAGYLYEDVQKEIASKTKLEFSAIKQAFESAGLESYNYDSEVYRKAGISSSPLNKSPFYLRLLQRNNEATNGEWYNYTRTTADQAQVDFIQACDNAYNLVSTGAVSYSDAVSEAVNSIGSKGVVVTYPSGHTDTLETATLRAVRTGTAQACGAITDARMDEYDWDIILVSAHLGARVTDKEDFTNHAWWQGKFYSKSGRDPRFPPFSVCGKGDVQGINGANCRHSYGPGDGVFNPYEKFDSEENKKAYELSQKQRAKERAIRKSKRELMALKTGVEECKDSETAEKLKSLYDRKKDVLNRQFSQYNSFCKENGLKPLYDRTEVAGYTTKAPKIEIGAFSSPSPKAVPVTDEIIENVPLIRFEGTKEGFDEAIQQGHKDLLSDVQSLDLGVEAGRVYDLNGRLLWSDHGTADHSSINIPDFVEPHFVMHNHPDDLIFSDDDLMRFIGRSSQEFISAFGNGGSYYVLQKTESYDGFSCFMALSKSSEALKTYVKENDISGYIAEIEKILRGFESAGVKFIRGTA